MTRIRNWLESVGAVVLIIAVLFGTGFLFVDYTSYSWEWLVTEAAPGVGAVASVILIWYYAQLYRASQEQSKAAQASYAPDLDVTLVSKITNHVQVQIVNRGAGVAKNIDIGICITSGATEYEYHAIVNQSLQPRQLITGSTSDGSSPNDSFQLWPRFYIQEEGQYYRGELAHLVAEIQENETIYARRFKLVVTYTDIIEDQRYKNVQRTEIKIPENVTVTPNTPLKNCPVYAGSLTVLPEARLERIKLRVRNLILDSNQESPTVEEYVDVHPQSES